ncbi:hypothetical protein ACE1ET_19855 [Saccharicrinis sp. FJH62]|uniref:hypothetical protein n=1 Tax=Saccharicrinis sp. FJH62 TaxID=3344657 RepID=UPI0035D47809
MKNTKKKIISCLLASIILFVSCSQYDSPTKDSCNIDAAQLENMHQSVKINLINAKLEDPQVILKSANGRDSETEYRENIQFVNENGLEALFEKNKIDIEVLSEVMFFNEHQNSETLYQDLIENFNIDNEDEALMLFTVLEIYNILLEQTSISLKSSGAEAARSITLGCALALAGTIGATVGFIWITGGAALIYALTMKGLATAALIEACSK